MPYSQKVLDRFNAVTNNPGAHGVGRFDPNDPNVATGMTGAPACGDVMKLDLKLNPDTEVIEDVKFKTYGCGSAIASSSNLDVLQINTIDGLEHSGGPVALKMFSYTVLSELIQIE